MLLEIRESQVQLFEEDAFLRFETRMQDYLLTELPEYCAAFGRGALEAEVREGLECARSFGFTSANALCRFLCLWLVLGRNFHLRAENAWMQEVLPPEEDLDPGIRMQWLYEGVLVRLEAAEQREQHA